MADLGLIAAAAAESRAKKVAQEIALAETRRLFEAYAPIPGEPGQEGKAGKDGRSILVGEGVPEKSDEIYLDTLSGDLWRDGSVIGNLRGPEGVAAKAVLPGVDGADGTSIFAGAGKPQADGGEGDLYIETKTGDLYRFDTGAWHVIGNLRGPKGETGAAGRGGLFPRPGGGGAGSQTAAQVPFTPAGTIAATDVQAAIEEVAAEAGGGGAPTTADYLVGTAQAGLSAEIVVGTTPGGELGNTWASPTVDASHSGSTHAATQAAAEATAAADATTKANAAQAASQPVDSDLTAIAALTPSNDDIIQRKAGAWTNRTIAQMLVDLALAGTTFQPLDADLTSIAALATTAFGRGLLALADPADATKFLNGTGAFSVPSDVGLTQPQVLARSLGA